MYELNDAYKEHLNNIAEAIQASPNLASYLEEEEDEFYDALKAEFEPQIEAAHENINHYSPLEIEAFELFLLDDRFEGMFLPRVLGYSVLRPEIDEQFYYARQNNHFGTILRYISTNSNFDQLRSRIGQAVEVGFALSSDIYVTSIVEEVSSKRVRQFYQQQRTDAALTELGRRRVFNRFRRQFGSRNYQYAKFPQTVNELRTETGHLNDFLLYRVGSELNNDALPAPLFQLLTKDAIVDRFRDRFAGRRPSVARQGADLRIHLYVDRKGKVEVSVDSSGEGLHRRGYRHKTLEAPLNEVLAAGLLHLAGYRGERPFVDPMCGSGTIVAEAAGIACRQAPGLFRSFGFERWPDFDADLWQDLRREALARRRTPPAPIVGGDAGEGAITIASATLERARLLPQVDLRHQDFFDLRAEDIAPTPGLLVTNPPYEMRLKTGDIQDFYRRIGDAFKHNWTGYTAWLISANPAAVKSVGLRTSQKVILHNGPLEARFCEYLLY